MKVIIKRKTYNTETATLLFHNTFGNLGDTNGYEENLYLTKTGNYFIHGLGGKDSKYPEEIIIPVSNEEAKKLKNTENEV